MAVDLANVKNIIQTSLADATITNFIDDAKLLIDELGITAKSEVLDKIILYTTAHFITLREPQLVSDKVGDATQHYNLPAKNSGFLSTTYGQMACSFDKSGVLANTHKQLATINWI